MTREPELGYKFIQGELDGFRTVTPVPAMPDPPRSGFDWAGSILEESLLKAGMFDPQPLPDNVIDITRRIQAMPEPLDPAFDPLWAQGVPGLDLASSIGRSYQPGPWGIVTPFSTPSVADMAALIQDWRDKFGAGPFELVYEPYPYRVWDNRILGMPVIELPEPFVSKEDVDGYLVPSLTDTITRDLIMQMRANEERLISDVFDIPLCLLGKECDHKGHKKLQPLPLWRRKWHALCGKLRWARERFARRVYELISEYPFDEEGEDW